MPFTRNIFRIVFLCLSFYLIFDNVNSYLPSSKTVRANVPGTAPLSDRCLQSGDIALTFDGGPSVHTQTALNALRDLGFKATFHVDPTSTGPKAAKAALKLTYKEGHTIGLLFPSSPDPRELSDEELTLEFAVLSARINEFTDVWPKFLRFSGNQYDQRVLNLAQSLGFSVSGYNLDAKDNLNIGLGQLKSAYDRGFKTFGDDPETKGSFIALHQDLYSAPMNAMKDLMQYISGKGWDFVDLSTCLFVTEKYRSTNQGAPDVLPEREWSKNSSQDCEDCDDWFSSASSVSNASLMLSIVTMLIK